MTARNLRTLAEYDVSDLVGLKTVVVNSAIEVAEDDGEISIEIPDSEALSAAAAVSRCLMPFRLLGAELKAIRHIAGLTAAELAAKMDDRASPETISRWENDKQLMGGYAEKVFRLIMCSELHERAPGIGYHDGAVARLVVKDPWRADPEFRVPTLVLERMRMRADDKTMIQAWGDQLIAA